MKTFVYYFKSDSGDSHMEQFQSEKPLKVHEAMKLFEWDDYDGWLLQGYEPEEIPYCEFMYLEIK